MTEQNPERNDSTPDINQSIQTVTLAHIPANLIWKAAGAFGAVLVGGSLFVQFVPEMVRPLAVLLAAIVLATALAPLADYLEQWLPRSLAVGLIFLSLLILVVGAGIVLVQPLVQETRSFIDSVPDYLEEIQFWVTDV